MEYRCEGLSRYGVVLVPPSSPEYAGLLADIQKRLTNPVAGSPPQLRLEDPDEPTMILCNRSQTAIAAPSWIWKLEPEAGRPMGSRVSTASVPSVLAPFGLEERIRKLYDYWHVILPGSKRGIRGNSLLGSNTDVRLPQPEEIWKGGWFSVGAGSGRSQGPLKSVTLTLDGVFFLDGGFAGPDTLCSFDRLTADVNAHLQAGRLARDGHYRGLSAQDIFKQLEEVTGPDRGPAPPRPPLPNRAGHFLEDSLRNLASMIGMMRQHRGDDGAIHLLVSWAETPLPSFRRL
jgi:hypothetical protein